MLDFVNPGGPARQLFRFAGQTSLKGDGAPDAAPQVVIRYGHDAEIVRTTGRVESLGDNGRMVHPPAATAFATQRNTTGLRRMCQDLPATIRDRPSESRPSGTLRWDQLRNPETRAAVVAGRK